MRQYQYLMNSQPKFKVVKWLSSNGFLPLVYIFVQMLWFQATWFLNGITSTGVFDELSTSHFESDHFSDVGGFQAPEVTGEREFLLGVYNALLLTHGEVLSQRLNATQPPRNR